MKSATAVALAGGGLFGGSESSGAKSHDREAAGVSAFELGERSIDELRAGLDSGRFTSRSLVRKYLTRIQAIDVRGPALRSVIEVNPDAPALAAELDEERRRRGPRGPLHGIPILIKDNLDTADRMATTAGSLALVGAKPPADAFVVGRLRAAGAVILGKTNLSEWANIRSSRSTSGWSSRGGQTRNPYALDRNPSGSSSGSAVAVAANLCAAAVGTETDGSIVSPSSVNGIVGIKPTVGLASRTGIVPISHTQDTAGPMARSVRDAAILLGAMTGVDPEDAATAESAGRVFGDYTRFLDPKGLAGARIGVVRNAPGFRKDRVIEGALAVLREAGAVLVDPANIETREAMGGAEWEILLHELKAGLAKYLARLGPTAPVRTLADVIRFNREHADRVMPFFDQETFLEAEARGGLDSPKYLESLERARRLSRAEGIDAVMDRHQLDALVAPTGGPAWLTDHVHGDQYSVASSSSFAAVAGYPSITVPAGWVFGLPCGISFFGRAWSEPVLLKLAYGFEQATRVRRPPGFPATAGVQADH